MIKRRTMPFKLRVGTFLSICKLTCQYLKQYCRLIMKRFRRKKDHKLVVSHNKRPKSLQLPITNMCNLRCKTCNVFNIRGEELNIDDIKRIVASDYFHELENVGINGGEPFLRPDIVSIIETLCDLPNLKMLSIISNGILTNRIIDRLKEVKKICVAKNVKVKYSTSIDGIDFIHNKIRGKKNAFNRTMETFYTIRKNKSLYCDDFGIISTISIHNIFYVNELLAYLEANNIKNITFQLAVDHSRLDNSENDVFSVLGNHKAKQMATEFFYQLFFETHSRKYYAIYRYLKDYPNCKRMSWCPFFDNNVTIDALGGLAYCATHSPIIGSIKSDEDIEAVYMNNLQTKLDILEKDCDKCVHYSRNNLIDYAEVDYLKDVWFLEVSKLKFKV